MVLNRLEKEIQEIREHQAADSLPDPLWEEINAIEDWEVYSSRESLQTLSNFETDNDDLQSLIEEVYWDGISIGELYEFAEEVAEKTKNEIAYMTEETPIRGPVIELETDRLLRAYPVWEKGANGLYYLTMMSDDEYIDAELLILSNKDIQDIDIEEAIVEAIRSWVRGE